jgi:hypothetical protein
VLRKYSTSEKEVRKRKDLGLQRKKCVLEKKREKLFVCREIPGI